MDPSGRTATAIAASLERGLCAPSAAAGQSLPTVRQLAVTLGVSPTTVAAAYKLLRARGLVTGQGRQGTRAASRQTAPASVAALAVPAGTRDLATGNPDEALLPPLEPALRSIQAEPGRYGIGPDRADLVAFASSEFEADGIPAGAAAVLSGGLDASRACSSRTPSCGRSCRRRGPLVSGHCRSSQRFWVRTRALRAGR